MFGINGLWAALLWGLIATVAMTTILYGSQGLGFSRLSLPFLMGTCVTSDRDWANIWGFLLYILGGWLFALVYLLVFMSLDQAGLLWGSVLGFFHGVFLLVVVLPLTPHLHPRMASDYDEPGTKAVLEPPAFLGLNYGLRTPLITMVAQTVYGAILGVSYQGLGLVVGS